MKPKYEIGQTVYVKPNLVSYKVLGIMQLESGGYQYCLSYSQYWENEKNLTDNNKKYYILYRSADGLEKREECQPKPKWTLYRSKIVECKIDHLLDAPPCGYREYSYQGETKNGDTVTYIYDEVI